MDEKPDRAGVVAPPPLLMVLCIAAGFLAEHFRHFPIFPAHHPIGRPLCFALFGAAVIIFGAAIRELIKHKTHPSPYKATAALVQTGIYRFSRNPIYVGFLVVVAACAACANSAWLLLAAVALFVLLRFGVVSREEQYLSRKFGDVYEEYRRKVRRWV
jgi:protein-S-isoprenylcysteine O-methyltransferase Ste14